MQFKEQSGVYEDVIGKTIYELLPGTENTSVQEYNKLILEKKTASFEQFSKDTGKYYRVNAFPTGSNKFATIFEDVTETKISERKIKENEERLRFIFDTTPFAVVTTIHDIIHYANPKLQRI